MCRRSVGDTVGPLSSASHPLSAFAHAGTSDHYIVRYHPSGEPTPSQADIRLTRYLIDAGRHMKIAIHDHVIVDARGRSRMKATGLI